MSAKITPWSDRMVELLLEAPTEREFLLSEMMALVPPGIGFRKAERARAVGRSAPRKTERRTGYLDVKAGDGRTVLVGAREICAAIVSSAVHDGRAVSFAQDEQKFYKAGPKIVRGPTARMAIVRHQQSVCYDDYETAADCYRWTAHVTEAIELHDAFLKK